MEVHYYNVDINWENSRKGIVCSPELNKENGVCIEVATPPEFPQGIAGIWSPEHLLVASVSGCLMTTFYQLPKVQLWNLEVLVARQEERWKSLKKN